MEGRKHFPMNVIHQPFNKKHFDLMLPMMDICPKLSENIRFQTDYQLSSKTIKNFDNAQRQVEVATIGFNASCFYSLISKEASETHLLCP